MTYIKTLTAPLIIIAGLALLTACGGGATPDEDPAVDCAETPFDSPDMCEDEKNTICQTLRYGLNRWGMPVAMTVLIPLAWRIRLFMTGAILWMMRYGTIFAPCPRISLPMQSV